MGFWIFMLICNMLIPLAMIGFGTYFMKSAPKEINGIFGYRTTMSMINKDTWEFAHKHCGNIWRNFGWIILAVTIFTMPFLIGKSDDAVGILGACVAFVQLVFLIVSIFPTESALNKTFDKDGNRKL